MDTLVTWTDRGPRALHMRNRPRNVGPVKSLIRHPTTSYRRVCLLSTREVLSGARQLAIELEEMGLLVEVHLVELVEDSYGGLFGGVYDILADAGVLECDGLISAGSPKARAVWLALVASGRFAGRLFQVVGERVVQVTLPMSGSQSAVVQRAVVPGGQTLREAVVDTERNVILSALDETGHNLLQTARNLDIDRNTLKRKMRQMGLRE